MSFPTCKSLADEAGKLFRHHTTDIVFLIGSRTMRTETSNRLIMAAVLGLIVLWCVIQTIGAWSHSRQSALILVATSGLLFVVWAIGVFLQRQSQTIALSTENQKRPWNRSALSAWGLSLISLAWLVPSWLPIQQTETMLVIEQRFSLLCAVLSLLLGIVGLSHPTIHHGKWYGLVAVAMALFAIVCFWWDI